VEEVLKDHACKILGLHISLQGTKILIAAIYGPNKVDEEFLFDLENIIIKSKAKNIILGGDWN
jgi:hypothetical protein